MLVKNTFKTFSRHQLLKWFQSKITKFVIMLIIKKFMKWNHFQSFNHKQNTITTINKHEAIPLILNVKFGM